MTQTQPGIDELLREGGAALRGGERERARALLAQAVRLNPRSEQAWLLLAGAVTDPEQRRSCLERVLRLNPEHTIARKAMAAMQTGGERQPASPAATPAAAATGDRRPMTGDRPQVSPAQAPPAGASLLGRLRQPEQPAKELPNFEQLLAGPAPASPQREPVRPQPAPVSRLPEPATPQPEPIRPQPAPPSPQPEQPARGLLSFEQLVASSSPASPQPASPQAEPVIGAPPPVAAGPMAVETQRMEASALPAPAGPTQTKRPANMELIELSMAGARRRERERRLWMAVLAVGFLMMLAGLGLALLVLLAG